MQGQHPGQAWGAVGQEKTVGGGSTFKGRKGPECGCHNQTSEDHLDQGAGKQEAGAGRGAPVLLTELGVAPRSD